MARRDRRRAKTGALAASLLFHLALFVVLARQVAPSFRTPAMEPDFQVQLVAEPPRPGAPRTPTPPAPRESRRIAPTAPAPPLPRPVLRSREEPAAAEPTSRTPHSARPTPPARPVAPRTPPPRSPAAPTPGPPGASARPGERPPPPRGGRWAVQGEDQDEDGVRTFLRATVGCSHADYVNLNAGERAACDRRVARAAREGAERVDGLSAEARSAFDAAVQAQEQARSARMGEPFVPCKGQGSNLDRGCINMTDKHPEDR